MVHRWSHFYGSKKSEGPGRSLRVDMSNLSRAGIVATEGGAKFDTEGVVEVCLDAEFEAEVEGEFE
jgi:hypothetical protein